MNHFPKAANYVWDFFTQKNFSFYLLVLILLVAFFFRFYNTPLRYSFSEDSMRDAMIAIEGAKSLQFPLTGPFSSIGPFTFGPWYYYQLILFTFITHFNYAPWIYLGLISTAFVFLMYKIGELLYGKNFGLLVASIVALSPSQVANAAVLSNPNLIPFYAALSVLFFLKLIKENKPYYWSFFFGLFLGIGINHHYQMVGLMILPILLLFYKPRKYRYFLYCILGVFVSFIPLLTFDMNNHWFTFRNMFYYYTEGRKAIYVPNRWLFYIRDFWPQFWSYTLGVEKTVGVVTIIFSFVAIIFSMIKRKMKITMAFLLIAFSFNFILLRFYWGERGYSYLQFLSPFIFIIVAFALWNIKKIKFGKYLFWISVLIFLFLMFTKSMQELGQGGFEKEMRREALLITNAYPNEKLVFYTCNESYLMRARALSFLLRSRNVLDEKGKSIGYQEGRCKLPKNKLVAYENYNVATAEMFLQKLYPFDKSSSTLDFTLASEAAILKEGWIEITPKKAYSSTLRWWFDEKP